MSYFGIPIRNGLPIGLGSVAPLASGGGSPFSPLSLFSGGAPGAWYDPSDYGATGTLFQDSAGTTPVTAVEQPVGLMLDKSQGLVLGTDVVVNGGFTTDLSGWSNNIGATWDSGGALLSATSASAQLAQSFTTVAGRIYKLEYQFVAGNSGNSLVRIGTSVGDGSILNRDMSAGAGSFTRYFFATGTTTWVTLFVSYPSVSITGKWDNISVRELPGNHAFQATSASRPVLSARYNLLTKTEDFSNSVWTKTGVTVSGTSQIIEAATTAEHSINYNFAIGGGAQVAGMVEAKMNGRRYLQLVSTQVTTQDYVTFDLQTGTVVGFGTTPLSYSITPTTDGYYLCKATFSAQTGGVFCALASSPSATWRQAYAGDGVSGVFMRNAQTQGGLTVGPYQRVNTATDYATTGFLPYLKFDGVDDSLSTNSISFTSTDKMSVFAGVRAVAFSANGFLYGIGPDPTSTAGTFALRLNTADKVQSLLFGSSLSNFEPTIPTIPSTNVTSQLLNIGAVPGLENGLRVNGAAATYAANSAGTGNFANQPLYMGRFAGTSSPFNGQMYSMIIVGKAVTAGELSSTETYVNQKTGAYA